MTTRPPVRVLLPPYNNTTGDRMNILKRLFRKKSPMELWAEHEVEVAVAREMEADRKDAEWHEPDVDYLFGGDDAEKHTKI